MSIFIDWLRRLAAKGGKVEVEAKVLGEIADRLEQLEQECETWRKLAR